MLLTEIKRIDSSTKKLREFGFVVGGVFSGLGLLLLWRGKGHFVYFLWPGLALVVLGTVFPALLKPLQKVWMAVAILMGWVMTRLLLSVLFYLAITPIALILKLTGKDILDIKLAPAQSSYWKQRAHKDHRPEDYERQF